MAGFIRRKKQGGRTYHYLVVNQRQRGRIKQFIIAYLGLYPTVQAALEGLQSRIEYCEEEARRYKLLVQQNAALEGQRAARGSPMFPSVFRYNHAKCFAVKYDREASERRERLAKLRRDIEGA